MNQSSYSRAVETKHREGLKYGGDVDVVDAWENLKADPKAVLVDVRTHAEWSYVGVPDLNAVGKQPLLVEWQIYPHMAVNDSFVEQVSAEVKDKTAPIYFLCRSGARSKQAAIEMTKNGYKTCYNVDDGFEGSHDSQKHRGLACGWKARGLPWVQG